MSNLYKVSIDILVEADNEAEACDAISESLRPLLREFADEPTSFIDWRYCPETTGFPVPHDGSGFEYGPTGLTEADDARQVAEHVGGAQ
jgi:hypothetical protein